MLNILVELNLNVLIRHLGRWRPPHLGVGWSLKSRFLIVGIPPFAAIRMYFLNMIICISFFQYAFFFLTTFSVCFWSSGLWRPASRFYNLGLDTYGLWFIASTSLKKDDKDAPFACLPGMLSNRRGNVCDSILQTVKLCIKSSSSPTSVSLLANIHWTLFCDKHCAWLLTFISSCNLMKSPCSLHFVSEETQA